MTATIAGKLADMFTTRTRTDGSRFWLLVDGAPDMLRDTVRDLHGDHMPNDTVHELCADVWTAVCEHAEHGADPTDPATGETIADQLAGGAWCYYSDRSRWFDGDPMARDACEEWREDYGGSGSVDDMIGGGLYVRLYGIAAALGDTYAELVADDTDGETVCEEHGQPIPATVTTGYSRITGTYRAVCDECGRVFIGWECLCEWDHHCPGVNQ